MIMQNPQLFLSKNVDAVRSFPLERPWIEEKSSGRLFLKLSNQFLTHCSKLELFTVILGKHDI